jgi:DNA-binding transcriptional LysR family regulator
MDLRRLEIFAKVAELGSFSRAADALFLTQPTVSEHVRALEDELGVQLLDRLGRGAAPTRAGQLLLGYARRILALALEARQAIDQFQGRMSGELIVGGSTIPGEYVLPSLVAQFRSKYPEVSISLLIGSSRQVAAWVEDGRVEVGMVGARPGGRTLEARELMDDELVVIVSSEHPWSGRETMPLDDVETEPMIVRERGSGSREALETVLKAAGTDLTQFRVVAEMGSTQAIKQAVRAGVGIAIISQRAVELECRARLIWCLRIDGVKIRRAFSLVTHRERSRSPLAQAFLEFVESQYPERPSDGPERGSDAQGRAS